MSTVAKLVALVHPTPKNLAAHACAHVWFERPTAVGGSYVVELAAQLGAAMTRATQLAVTQLGTFGWRIPKAGLCARDGFGRRSAIAEDLDRLFARGAFAVVAWLLAAVPGPVGRAR
jgi:hypothetical protein